MTSYQLPDPTTPTPTPFMRFNLIKADDFVKIAVVITTAIGPIQKVTISESGQETSSLLMEIQFMTDKLS